MLVVFVFTVILFIGIFCWYGRAYARIAFPQEYWFLVRACEESTAAAVVGSVYLSGGAGYLIEEGGEQSVVLACYYTQTSAESVQSHLNGKGVETRILHLEPHDLALNGKNAAQSARIEANASLADSCAKILYETANKLELTEYSQEEARAAVRGVVSSLAGLRAGNEGSFYELWNAVLFGAERQGAELAEGILFAKDIRYLQVRLCYAIVNICDCFT